MTKLAILLGLIFFFLIIPDPVLSDTTEIRIELKFRDVNRVNRPIVGHEIKDIVKSTSNAPFEGVKCDPPDSDSDGLIICEVPCGRQNRRFSYHIRFSEYGGANKIPPDKEFSLKGCEVTPPLIKVEYISNQLYATFDRKLQKGRNDLNLMINNLGDTTIISMWQQERARTADMLRLLNAAIVDRSGHNFLRTFETTSSDLTYLYTNIGDNGKARLYQNYVIGTVNIMLDRIARFYKPNGILSSRDKDDLSDRKVLERILAKLEQAVEDVSRTLSGEKANLAIEVTGLIRALESQRLGDGNPVKVGKLLQKHDELHGT